MEKKKDITELNSLIKEYGFAIGAYKFFRKPVNIEIGFIDDICSISIEELSLSARGYNSLMRCNVKTIGDVIDLINQNKLKNLKNLGTKTSIEIKSKIIDYGFNALSEKRKSELIDNLYYNNI